MKIIASLAFLISAVCAASTTENTTVGTDCPVSIYRSSIVFRTARNAQVLEIRYTNTTQVNIIGAKFGLELMDSTGDFSPYLSDESDSQKTKPTARSIAEWDLLTVNRESSGYRITVKKIAFSDGTTWQDDGTNKCRVVEDNRRH